MTASRDSAFAARWRRAYDELAERLPELCGRARPLLAGFSACVDKQIDLHAVAPALAKSDDPRAQSFLADMLSRARDGRGGETLFDWPDGPAFLDRFAKPGEMSLGGTSAQAAWTLAAIGAPAVLALESRSRDQLAVLHPDILFANGTGRLVKTAELVPFGAGKPAHYIVEYFAGRPLGDVTPNRSTRVIVRFADEDIERDAHFHDYARRHASECGPGLLSSPNAIPPGRFDKVLDELSGAAREWRSSGERMIHLELGDYARPGSRDAAIARLAPVITSLGLNLHELDGFELGDGSPATRAHSLAKKLGVTRLAVHADDWTLAVVRGDPGRERLALMLGALLASARAAAGKPVRHPRAPDKAELSPPPFPEEQPLADGWTLVSAPTPFLRIPVSTLGLGDTFTAGTMLAYAQPEANHG